MADPMETQVPEDGDDPADDPVGDPADLWDFIEAECICTSDAKMLRSEAWARYQRWAKHAGVTAMGRNEFHEAMRQEFTTAKVGGNFYFRGVLLIDRGADA